MFWGCEFLVEKVVMDNLEMFTVYRGPKDYPDEFVVRRFVLLPKPTPCEIVARSETLEGVRAALSPYLVCLGREPDDDPSIVEVWL